ncbi:hypothetical protein BH18ACT2_BH18ACT2_21040 [soil metagenome]
MSSVRPCGADRSPRLAELIAAEADPTVTGLTFGDPDPTGMAAAIERWIIDHLGQPVVDAWLWHVSVGCVAGVRLADATDAVIKVRPPPATTVDQLAATQSAQRLAAAAGLPAPLPLAGPAQLAAGVATADTALRHGRPPNMRRPDERGVAAAAWTQLVHAFTDVVLPMPVRPRDLCGLYPTPHAPLFDFEGTSAGAEWIDALAHRARQRIETAPTRPTLVHLDWRPPNLRIDAATRRLTAIYDWDAIALEPEPFALGMVAAMLSVDHSAGAPYFATADECVAFAGDAELDRVTPFTTDEWPVIRAGIVFGWCYTARCEHALASVGDDKPAFGMRRRLHIDGCALLDR